MSTRLLALPLALCVLALGPAIAHASSRVAGDFDGDGHDDLAVGVPYEDYVFVDEDGFGDMAPDAGAVQVIYGSPDRLAAEGEQWWSQDSPGIEGDPDWLDFHGNCNGGNCDEFGSSLAAGDFDGDGFDDLAVGVLYDDVTLDGGGVAEDVGAVDVIYGSQDGLTAEGNQRWHPFSPGIAAPRGRFGATLTAGDLNGDGHDDLAVGVPGADVGSVVNAGAVNVIYGAAVGLRAKGNQLWHQNQPGIEDAAETSDGFGARLAAGDLDGDGHDDLAVGVPSEDFGSVVNAGAVNVLYGSASRLNPTGNQLWHQDSTGIADAAETSDHFGSPLAAGDLNGDGHDDLAVGVPSEDVGGVSDAGAVNVLYGAAVGLRATGNQLWHQNQPGIEDAAEAGDFFGARLAAGDLDGDGHDDLAVGVPYEDFGSVVNAGAVNVIYGSASRLNPTGNQLWHQDSTGIADAAEAGDIFGYSLTAGDFNGNGDDDLAVGVPGEDIGSAVNAGAVNVIYGAGVGLRADGNQLWHQDNLNIVDAAEAGDSFGELPT